MSAIDGLMPPTKKTKKFLLFLPPDEWHEVGLLFANYIIRSKGYETVYFGQSVPIENVEKAITIIRPKYILLFYIAMRPASEIEEHIRRLSKIDEKITVLVAGNAALFSENKNKAKSATYLTEVNSLLNFL